MGSQKKVSVVNLCLFRYKYYLQAFLSHILGATKAKIKIEPRVILGVTIHWTGLLDWNTEVTYFWFYRCYGLLN